MSGAAGTPPTIRYARSGDINIAYATLGEGPLDLVYVPGAVSNVELSFEEPPRSPWQAAQQPFFRRLASFSRLITFDKRGTGSGAHRRSEIVIADRLEDAAAAALFVLLAGRGTAGRVYDSVTVMVPTSAP